MILIFNGSPHKDGNTSYAVEKIALHFKDTKIIYAYDENIRSCIACERCKGGKCAFDDMEEIYSDIKKADVIIIASPLYFSAPTGKLMDMFSRFEYFYNNPLSKPKSKGIIIYMGGGTTKTISTPLSIGRIILRSLGISDIDSMVYVDTDRVPSNESEYVENEIERIIEEIQKARGHLMR